MDNKQFPEMSQQEQSAWLADFQTWYADALPSLETMTAVTADLRASAEKGLALLSSFRYCRSFVREALRFHDYAARKKLFRRYADRVMLDVQNQLGASVKVDLTDPALLKPHRGRPSRAEAAARAIKREMERKAAEEKEQTLFGKRADIPKEEPAAPATVSGSLYGGAMFHLDQLRWLMSPALAEAVETIRDLRAKAAEAATTAKTLAQAGKPEADVKPYTEAAIQYTEDYERIYEQVDNEMATVYVRLKEDTAFIETIKAKKVDPYTLRSNLRPYWDKQSNKDAFRASVIEDIKRNDPAQAAIREAEEKKHKAVADIIKYLTRRDKQNTPTRIATMTARYAELEKLIGDEAKDYLPVLEAAREDCEKHVIPAQEAKAAALAAKQAEKKANKRKPGRPKKSEKSDLSEKSETSKPQTL